MARPPRCAGAWLRPADWPRGYVDLARQLACRGKRRPGGVRGLARLTSAGAALTIDPRRRSARRLHSKEQPFPYRKLAEEVFRYIPAHLPAVLAHEVLDGALHDEQDRVRSQFGLLEFVPVQTQECCTFQDEVSRREAELVVGRLDGRSVLLGRPLLRLRSPDPLDEWTVDGFHPGPQRRHDSMPVAVAGNEPPLPRGGVADLTGRVPAGRPIRQPPAHQVTTGTDRTQRLVIDVQGDEALLEVSRAAVEAFGEWPRPWTLVGGSKTTPDRVAFGGMRRDHRLPFCLRPSLLK